MSRRVVGYAEELVHAPGDRRGRASIKREWHFSSLPEIGRFPTQQEARCGFAGAPLSGNEPFPDEIGDHHIIVAGKPIAVELGDNLILIVRG